MKTTIWKHSATLIAALAAASATSQASVLITTIGTTDASINWTNVGGAGSPAVEGSRFEADLVNNSGITTEGGKLVHNGGDNGVVSNLTQLTGGLIIDLGATYNLALMQIWNFNAAFNGGQFKPVGPQTFDFYYTNDANAVTLTGGTTLNVANLSLFTSLTNNTALALATSANGYLGETYTFGSPTMPAEIGDQSGASQSLSGTTITARYIFLDDLTGDNTSFGPRMGFSELKFYQVPEPSAALLGGLGLLALLRRRR